MNELGSEEGKVGGKREWGQRSGEFGGNWKA